MYYIMYINTCSSTYYTLYADNMICLTFIFPFNRKKLFTKKLFFMQFFQCLCSFAGFCKRVNKTFLKKVLTFYVIRSSINVSTGKDSRQCSNGGLGTHRKIPKTVNKTFSKSFKKYLTQPNSCGKVQSSTRAQLVE